MNDFNSTNEKFPMFIKFIQIINIFNFNDWITYFIDFEFIYETKIISFKMQKSKYYNFH